MHHETLSHIDIYCTSCRTFEEHIIQHKLKLIPKKTNGDYIITGWLECVNCGKRYRIVDGVPHMIQGVSLGEEQTAQYLDAHYSNINISYWEEMDSFAGNGLCLDVGCSVGRYTFECAKKGFAVGIDANYEHLRQAAEIMRTGILQFRRKTRALNYEKVTLDLSPSKNTLFMVADIHDPPFKMDTFDFISGLNLIDSVKLPLTALGQMDAMLKKHGELFLSTPYTWNPEVSGEWLETEDIEPHSYIKQLLTGKQVPESGFNYRIGNNKTGIFWRMRKQDNQQYEYFVDAISAEKL